MWLDWNDLENAKFCYRLVVEDVRETPSSDDV